MNIEIEKFLLNVNEQELYIIAFAIRDKLAASAQHCATHSGMDTFWSNYTAEAKMLESICTRLDRLNIYRDLVDTLEKEILKIQQAV